jgi:chromosome segregation ATPase
MSETEINSTISKLESEFKSLTISINKLQTEMEIYEDKRNKILQQIASHALKLSPIESDSDDVTSESAENEIELVEKPVKLTKKKEPVEVEKDKSVIPKKRGRPPKIKK